MPIKPSNRSRRQALALLVFAALPTKALPMSFFNPLKTCVFSAVRARLTRNGQPLRGATVVRSWEWQSEGQDQTKTDNDGWFAFPAAYASSVTRLFPIEVVIAQELAVTVDGKLVSFWSNSKRRPGENEEFGGKSISMVCELTNAMRNSEDFDSRMRTLCTWDK